MECANGHTTSQMTVVSTYETRDGYGDVTVTRYQCLTCERVVESYTYRSRNITHIKEITPSRYEIRDQEREREELERRKGERIKTQLEELRRETERAEGRRAKRQSARESAFNRDLPVPLDKRKILNIECRICGASGIRPQSFLRINPEDYQCTISAECSECHQKTDYRLDVETLFQETGSPVARDFCQRKQQSMGWRSQQQLNVGLWNRLAEVIADTFGVDKDKITIDSRLSDDLGADELDCVELIMHLEKVFNVDIPDTEAEGMKTARDLYSYLQGHIVITI